MNDIDENNINRVIDEYILNSYTFNIMEPKYNTLFFIVLAKHSKILFQLFCIKSVEKTMRCVANFPIFRLICSFAEK